MAKKESEKQRSERIRKTVGNKFNYWLDKLEVCGFATYVLLPTDQGWSAGEDTSFTVLREWPYKKIMLSVSKDSFEFFDEKWHNLEKSLLHEAVHILLWEYTRMAECRFISDSELRDKEEETVDHIANNLLRNWL